MKPGSDAAFPAGPLESEVLSTNLANKLEAQHGQHTFMKSASSSPETVLPNRPRDWSRAKKWTATMILSSFAFLQPLSETMLSPVEIQITRDLHIKRSYEWFLVNSLILIGVGLAPLILAPLSEVYGRKPILVGGSIVFLIWNTGCGAARNLDQLLAFRLLSGFGACVADAIAGGVMSDLWRAEERGTAFAFFMAAPLLGPALGPICGAFISEGTDWRWVFWISSIASAVVTVIAIFLLHETYEPRLLERFLRKQKTISETTSESGPDSDKAVGPASADADAAEEPKAFGEIMRENLQRPLRMLATQLIVQLLALYMALLYGTMFLFLFLYPRMWTKQYNQSVRIGSLNYISAAIGYIGGVMIGGTLNDKLYARLKARNNGVGRPEFRVPVMVIGTVLVPIGLLWWGWSGERKMHWIMPNIGCLIFTAGCYVCSSCVSVYTIDTYTRYAASAISTNLVLRSIAAALFPLFAPYMFESLGFGLGATVLAGGFLVVGSVAILVLWVYGAQIRAKSPYCAVGDDDDQ